MSGAAGRAEQGGVSRILSSVTNLKHKTMLMLTYSAGLRVGEVVGLRVKDIDVQRTDSRLRRERGKDRYTILSDVALVVLHRYLEQYRPDDWLFQGDDPDRAHIG